MQSINATILQQIANDKSVIITRGYGPCPVFARGDRRTLATHWLARDHVKTLESQGLLRPVENGFCLSKDVQAKVLSGDALRFGLNSRNHGL